MHIDAVFQQTHICKGSNEYVDEISQRTHVRNTFISFPKKYNIEPISLIPFCLLNRKDLKIDFHRSDLSKALVLVHQILMLILQWKTQLRLGVGLRLLVERIKEEYMR